MLFVELRPAAIFVIANESKLILSMFSLWIDIGFVNLQCE